MSQRQEKRTRSAEKKAWYNHWWGVTLAVLTWPVFLVWHTWAKSGWPKLVKVSMTALVILLVATVIGDIR